MDWVARTLLQPDSSTRHRWAQDHDGDGNPDIGLILRDSYGFDIDDPNVKIKRYSFANRYWYPIAEVTMDGDRAFFVIEIEERNASLQYGGPDFWGLLFPARMNLEREAADPEPDYVEYIAAK